MSKLYRWSERVQGVERERTGASQIVLRRKKGPGRATFDACAVGQNEAGKAALTL